MAELLAGNLAELCINKGISWRWAVVGLGAGCGASSLAVFAFLREPPVGRFIVKKEVRCMIAPSFDLLKEYECLFGRMHHTLTEINICSCGNLHYVIRDVHLSNMYMAHTVKQVLCGVVLICQGSYSFLMNRQAIGYGMQGKDRPQKPDFSIKQVVLYMVSMSSMWILTIATGADLP